MQLQQDQVQEMMMHSIRLLINLLVFQTKQDKELTIGGTLALTLGLSFSVIIILAMKRLTQHLSEDGLKEL